MFLRPQASINITVLGHVYLKKLSYIDGAGVVRKSGPEHLMAASGLTSLKEDGVFVE